MFRPTRGAQLIASTTDSFTAISNDNMADGWVSVSRFSFVIVGFLVSWFRGFQFLDFLVY